MKFGGLIDSITYVFVTAAALRTGLLLYGHYQDQNSALKYTDIDYYVFTDAARYVSRGQSPYYRDTYRYTPLLAWMLIPTTWQGWWFDFGKVLFASSDILAGYFIYATLRSSYHMTKTRALRFSSLWLLNPMVAQISTRGSSEGIVAMLVTVLLWACLQRKYILAGVLLGTSVHVKIYPFIYAASILLWITDNEHSASRSGSTSGIGLFSFIRSLFTPASVKVIVSSAASFFILNLWMFSLYGWPFLEHTYFYHLVRTDHRHNFSPYNLLLYLKASPAVSSGIHPETLAFLPQLFLSLVGLPLCLARSELALSMFAQTFSFVTFNKVCTSQYFLWYMVFLPFYLPDSTLLAKPRLGSLALGLWILGQALWLQQGYLLEFLGKSSFVPGLWASSLLFFGINAWILGIIVSDNPKVVPSPSRRRKKA